MTEPLLLTVLEAADVLRLSRSKLYELMGAGIVPSIQIGRARRISMDDLRALVIDLTQLAGPSSGNLD
jgi:excisionase family DNA binding protein